MQRIHSLPQHFHLLSSQPLTRCFPGRTHHYPWHPSSIWCHTHTHPRNPNKTYTPLFTNPSLPTMQLLLTNRCILNYLYAYYSIVPLLHAIKHFVDTNRNCLQQLIVHIVNALDLPLCRLRRHKKTRNPHAAQT